MQRNPSLTEKAELTTLGNSRQEFPDVGEMLRNQAESERQFTSQYLSKRDRVKTCKLKPFDTVLVTIIRESI